MSMSALLTIAERWKPLQCPSTDEWIKWNIPQPQRTEVLTPAVAWMNLEDVLLTIPPTLPFQLGPAWWLPRSRVARRAVEP